jgi:hypothetical protein
MESGLTVSGTDVDLAGGACRTGSISFREASLAETTAVSTVTIAQAKWIRQLFMEFKTL